MKQGLLDSIIEANEDSDEAWDAAMAKRWPPTDLEIAQSAEIWPLLALAAMPPVSVEIH
jgi:hypothetical protein